MNSARQIVPILCLFLTAVFSAPIWATDVVDLGSLDFPNSGSKQAQGPFYRGVLLLHSFEYVDAREEFQAAQEIDPDFALAYWGEAMTHNHPLWRQQDLEAARDALDKLAPSFEERAAKAPTEREKGFLAAVEVLFGEGGKVQRDYDYSEVMRGLSERYPDDLEAKSFHALSVLGTRQGERDFSVYMQAASIVEEVFAVNPRHPGAAHYLIHSYDDPVHAPLGLRAARVYADIAPAASHAQHMISHIFVAMGEWENSVESNVNAWEVSVDRAKKKGLDADAQNYHALYWLMYSYLQLGRYEEARAKLDMMAGFAEETKTGRSTWHYAAMRAAYIVETGASKLPTSIEPDSLRLSGAAKQYFADGFGALNAGDLDEARLALGALEEAIESSSPGSLDKQVDWFSEVSDGTLADATVQLKSLGAMIALEEGKTDRAIQLLEEATAIESSRPLEYGPPSITQPSHELYGHVLSTLKQPEEAIEQYEIALQRAPRRSRSLGGLAEAAKAMGNDATREAACVELESIHASADESFEPPAACS